MAENTTHVLFGLDPLWTATALLIATYAAIMSEKLNRAIVALGLKDLAETKDLGLRALMDVSDCHSEMTVYDIGFRIAPRINAAGRMDAAKVIVELLECADFGVARKMADILNTRNRDRQQPHAQPPARPNLRPAEDQASKK